jgi:hypothetical protein
MEQTNGIKTWQWVVTAIVIVALIVVGIVVFSNKGTVDTTGDVADTRDNTSNVSVNRIVIGDQYPGNVVYVSSVQLANGGWIVIHKDNAGKPGDVIGSVYSKAGVGPAKITLTSSMVDSALYYAMLHNDDGDGKFDASKDLPMTDSNGSAIMKTFRASVSVGAEIKG